MSLRELNHRRTREALVGAALELFLDRGPQEVTVDDVCGHAQIARRTYFRYFATKEAVAVAPLEDLWEAFVDHVPTKRGDTTILEHFTDALIETLAALPPTWPGAAVTSLRLVALRPEIDAAARAMCGRTATRALDAIGGDRRDPAVNLAGDLFAAGVVEAQQRWISGRRKPTTTSLQRLIAQVPAQLADALVITT